MDYTEFTRGSRGFLTRRDKIKMARYMADHPDRPSDLNINRMTGEITFSDTGEYICCNIYTFEQVFHMESGGRIPPHPRDWR